MSKSAKPRRRLAFSIQTKILIASAALMACMMAFSVTVVVLGSELGKIALDLYDKSFVSVHYAHKVQTAFVRLEALHTDADLPLKADDDTAAVTFDRSVWAELTTLRFVDDNHNALLLGPVGVGIRCPTVIHFL